MEIKDIKQQLSIVRVLEHYGLQTDKNGRLCCPFHEDSTPSMQIYPASNTYCCFSSNCNAGTGDQVQFIELKEQQGKHQAILKAKELLGVISSTPVESNDLPGVEVLDYDRLFGKLKQNIGKSPRAKNYLEARNLDIEKLEIGYNSGTFPQLKDCVIFPLKDKQNKVVSLYGRALSKGHYYTANRTGLYPNYPSSETRILILTESVIDAATLQQTQRNTLPTDFEVLALYGTNGFTQEHTEAVSQLKHLQEIILWFDGDEAGRKAVEKYKEELKTVYPHILISHIETPENEDINSLLQGHDSSNLSSIIN